VKKKGILEGFFSLPLRLRNPTLISRQPFLISLVSGESLLDPNHFEPEDPLIPPFKLFRYFALSLLSMGTRYAEVPRTPKLLKSRALSPLHTPFLSFPCDTV